MTSTTPTGTTRTDTTPVEIHPLLAERWSPRAFDRTPLADDDVTALLEAARWAPSAMNSQPWRFLVGQVGEDGADATHKALFDTLAGGNQVWASEAPLLVAALARVAEPDGAAREIGSYELGLAVAQLSIQAQALGLVVHQMGGFDRDRLVESFAVPSTYRPVVVLAVGRVGDPASLPEWAREREGAPRERLPLEQIAYAETWGMPLAG